MQGDSAVQDMDFQRALKASPYEEKDLPQLSSDIGEAYTRLAPEQKQQLQDNMKRDGLAKMLRYGTRFTRILIKDIRINKSEHFGKIKIKFLIIVQNNFI